MCLPVQHSNNYKCHHCMTSFWREMTSMLMFLAPAAVPLGEKVLHIVDFISSLVPKETEQTLSDMGGSQLVISLGSNGRGLSVSLLVVGGSQHSNFSQPSIFLQAPNFLGCAWLSCLHCQDNGACRKIRIYQCLEVWWWISPASGHLQLSTESWLHPSVSDHSCAKCKT